MKYTIKKYIPQRIGNLTKFTAILIILSFNACQNKEPMELYINIEHVVKGEKLVIEDKTYNTAAGNGYKVFRLKYYLSKFILESDDGTTQVIDTAHLWDILDTDTYLFKAGKIPAANYTKLSFIFGLDKSKNFEGSLENNMENNSMEWPVMGEKGYHYMKFEGKYDSLHTGILKNFHLHTGPTDNNQNFVKITLNLPKMKSESSTLGINLAMDIDKILHSPNDYDFNVFSHGIMGTQSAQKILKENGKDVFQIISID